MILHHSPTAANSTEENIAKSGLLHPDNLVIAPGTYPLLPELLGTSQAEYVLARDHPPVDQDRLQTLVTRVNHWVENLLAHQVDRVVPVQVQHAGGVASVNGGEGWRLQLANVRLHVILGDLSLGG